MSLQDRLRKIEQDIRDLKEVIGDLAGNQQALADAYQQDDAQDHEPATDLDGNQYGGERDTAQSLDG